MRLSEVWEINAESHEEFRGIQIMIRGIAEMFSIEDAKKLHRELGRQLKSLEGTPSPKQRAGA